MGWEEMLQSENLLTLVILAGMALWTFFRSRSFLEGRKNKQVHIALQALEAAVDATYREYVRMLKENRESGKLTEQEEKEARRRAREKGVGLSRESGVDLITTLGADYVDLWINRLVRKLKAGG
ncbi:MAG: hypothetical protein GX130_13310 [Candidatus Hydrogenedens sp.]|jgi:hypothetical protein|nr:hypothetical protein [Candidatus Hydrogenedens sp.]